MLSYGGVLTTTSCEGLIQLEVWQSRLLFQWLVDIVSSASERQFNFRVVYSWPEYLEIWNTVVDQAEDRYVSGMRSAGCVCPQTHTVDCPGVVLGQNIVLLLGADMVSCSTKNLTLRLAAHEEIILCCYPLKETFSKMFLVFSAVQK